jgi:dihydrofolate synthase/folylpolyglutamate synthase
VVGYFNQFYRQSSFLINQLNLTYHEALVCFEYFLFAEEKVQVAVVEVDLGGLFDCTNVVSSFNKICVISDIGYDHTQVLGSKISQVASQKAGIIQPKNTVIFIQQSYQTSSKIILEQAKKQRATDIIEVTNLQNSNLRPGLQPSFFQQIDTSDKKVSLNLEFQTQKLSLKTNLIGNFQAKNLALALTSSLIFLEKNTLNLDLKKLQNCLSKVQIVGKMDLKKIIYSNQEVNCILDGAHNPQKMEAFLSSLTKIFSNQKFVFVVAFKNSKDHLKMLKLICKYASYLIITKFVVGNTASQVSKVILNTEFKTIESSLKKLKFSNYSLTENYQEALELGLQKIVVKNLDANNNSQPILVFTGSIYFLGNIYPALEKFD